MNAVLLAIAFAMCLFALCLLAASVHAYDAGSAGSGGNAQNPDPGLSVGAGDYGNYGSAPGSDTGAGSNSPGSGAGTGTEGAR